MSAHTGMKTPPLLEESDLRMIEAEIERAGSAQPFYSAAAGIALATSPCPHAPAFADCFGVRHTLEWSKTMSPKTRHLDDLRAWTKRELTSPDICSTDMVARHLGLTGTVGQINAAIDAFLARLNRAPGFRDDGLTLMSGDVPSNPTVNQLLKAIVSDYERRDIEVIL